jgi:hypothetical protein
MNKTTKNRFNNNDTGKKERQIFMVIDIRNTYP